MYFVLFLSLFLFYKNINKIHVEIIKANKEQSLCQVLTIKWMDEIGERAKQRHIQKSKEKLIPVYEIKEKKNNFK